MKHLILTLAVLAGISSVALANNEKATKEDTSTSAPTQKEENTSEQKRKKSIRYIEETEIFLMPEDENTIA